MSKAVDGIKMRTEPSNTDELTAVLATLKRYAVGTLAGLSYDWCLFSIRG